MGSTALIQTLRESFTNYSGVKTLFGEPVEAQGKTVIPVAQVSYGFGAGSGSRSDDQSSGGGGGGGLKAAPVGVVEITPLTTRFSNHARAQAVRGGCRWFGLWDVDGTTRGEEAPTLPPIVFRSLWWHCQSEVRSDGRRGYT